MENNQESELTKRANHAIERGILDPFKVDHMTDDELEAWLDKNDNDNDPY